MYRVGFRDGGYYRHGRLASSSNLIQYPDPHPDQKMSSSKMYRYQRHDTKKVKLSRSLEFFFQILFLKPTQSGWKICGLFRGIIFIFFSPVVLIIFFFSLSWLFLYWGYGSFKMHSYFLVSLHLTSIVLRDIIFNWIKTLSCTNILILYQFYSWFQNCVIFLLIVFYFFVFDLQRA